jgi:hypothetical protein
MFVLVFLFASSFTYSAEPATNKAYIDAAAFTLGAAMGAVHFRAGVEVPLSPSWTAGGEGGVYWSSNPHTFLFQTDLVGLVRWKPMGDKGIFLGPGLGLALVNIGFRASEEEKVFSVRPIALAEVGWTFSPKKGDLSFDTVFRLTVAGGLSLSPAFGFRAAHSF